MQIPTYPQLQMPLHEAFIAKNVVFSLAALATDHFAYLFLLFAKFTHYFPNKVLRETL